MLALLLTMGTANARLRSESNAFKGCLTPPFAASLNPYATPSRPRPEALAKEGMYILSVLIPIHNPVSLHTSFRYASPPSSNDPNQVISLNEGTVCSSLDYPRGEWAASPRSA